jgi:hypothetical protein
MQQLRMDQPAAHDLVPLELAARTIYQRVYAYEHGTAGVACTLEHLNGIAYAVAALVAVFTHDHDTVRRLNEDEMVKGLFREGGRSLIFLDGRSSIGHLAVHAETIEQVARALSEQGSGAS